jgi:multisubunit Na+/H+ antiporter MnhB subunit
VDGLMEASSLVFVGLAFVVALVFFLFYRFADSSFYAKRIYPMKWPKKREPFPIEARVMVIATGVFVSVAMLLLAVLGN